MNRLDDLLLRCDSLLSLIRHREASGLSEQTIRDLDELLPLLRAETDRIVSLHRAGPVVRDEGGG